MASYDDFGNRWTSLIRLLPRRNITVQQYLSFLEIPLPEECVWDKLDDAQKTRVVEVLARVIVKAAVQNQEGNDD